LPGGTQVCPDALRTVTQALPPRPFAAPHEMQHRPQQGHGVFPVGELFGQHRPYLAELKLNGPHQLAFHHQRQRVHHPPVAAQKFFVDQHDLRHMARGGRQHDGGALLDGFIHRRADHPQHLGAVRGAGADGAVGQGHHAAEAILDKTHGNALAAETGGEFGGKGYRRLPQAVVGHHRRLQGKHVELHRFGCGKGGRRVQSFSPERMSSSY